MTGYASASLDLPGLTLHLELRSVNSRYLDVSFRMPDELRALESPLRDMIVATLSRGKVECRLNSQRRVQGDPPLSLNTALLGKLRVLEQGVLAEIPDAARLSVGELLRWPGMILDESASMDELQAAIATLGAASIKELAETREREGERLARLILERIQAMRSLVKAMEPRIPQIVAEHQEKLATRLREAVASFDEERIRQEVALFAVRTDVAEELNRLVTHLDEVERVIKKGGAVGKRLDFLMQELNREANTLGSKSVATDQTSTAVELKILIEQMREQIQNLE
jgi:uncharacterized protein (TIGR00255 family)